MDDKIENDIIQLDEDSEYFFNNIDNNFSRYCFQKIDIFDEKLIFGVYDHYEAYNKQKKYNKDKYLAIYTGTPFYYLDFIYCIVIEGNNEKLYYVVAKRVPSDIQNLKKYCSCVRCSTIKLNPLKYIWCKFCTGCLKSGEWHAHPKYVEEAKKRKANDLYPDNKNKIVNPDSISHCELTGCALFCLIILYCGFYYL